MNKNTVFILTAKGTDEIKKNTPLLAVEVKRALVLVDEKSTVEVLTKRAPPSLRTELVRIWQELLNGGFIQDKTAANSGNSLRIVSPKIAVPAKNIQEEGGNLDFTNKMRAFPQAGEEREQVEARAKDAADTLRHKAAQESAAVKMQLEATQAKTDAETKARIEAAASEKQATEALHLKTTQEIPHTKAHFKTKKDAGKPIPELTAARLQAAQLRAGLAAAKIETQSTACLKADR